VFAKVVPGKWKVRTNDKPPVFVVLLDFADFECLIGDAVALNAFDVGWALLHELNHVAHDAADAASLEETGECEALINEMRRECNLPERTTYFFTFIFLAADRSFSTQWVRLPFDHEDPVLKKKKRYWLIWDASLVGGLPYLKQVASLR
jgi:hypothetical protein